MVTVVGMGALLVDGENEVPRVESARLALLDCGRIATSATHVPPFSSPPIVP